MAFSAKISDVFHKNIRGGENSKFGYWGSDSGYWLGKIPITFTTADLTADTTGGYLIRGIDMIITYFSQNKVNSADSSDTLVAYLTTVNVATAKLLRTSYTFFEDNSEYGSDEANKLAECRLNATTYFDALVGVTLSSVPYEDSQDIRDHLHSYTYMPASGSNNSLRIRLHACGTNTIGTASTDNIRPGVQYYLYIYRIHSTSATARFYLRGEASYHAYIYQLQLYKNDDTITNFTINNIYIPFNNASNSIIYNITCPSATYSVEYETGINYFKGWRITNDKDGLQFDITSDVASKTGGTFTFSTSDTDIFTEGRTITISAEILCTDVLLNSAVSSDTIQVNNLPACPILTDRTLGSFLVTKNNGHLLYDNFNGSTPLAPGSDADNQTYSIYYSWSETGEKAELTTALTALSNLTFNEDGSAPVIYKLPVYFWTYDGYNFSATFTKLSASSSDPCYFYYEDLNNNPSSHDYKFEIDSSASNTREVIYGSSNDSYYAYIVPKISYNKHSNAYNYSNLAISYLYYYDSSYTAISITNDYLDLYNTFRTSLNSNHTLYVKIKWSKMNGTIVVSSQESPYIVCETIFNMPSGPALQTLWNLQASAWLGDLHTSPITHYNYYKNFRANYTYESLLSSYIIYASEPYSNYADANATTTTLVTQIYSGNINATFTLASPNLDYSITSNLVSNKWYKLTFYLYSSFNKNTPRSIETQVIHITGELPALTLTQNGSLSINNYPFMASSSSDIVYILGGFLYPENYDIYTDTTGSKAWAFKMETTINGVTKTYDPGLSWTNTSSGDAKTVTLRKDFFFYNESAHPFDIRSVEDSETGVLDYSLLNLNYVVKYRLYYYNKIDPTVLRSILISSTYMNLCFLSNFTVTDFNLNKEPLDNDDSTIVIKSYEENLEIIPTIKVTTYNSSNYRFCAYYLLSDNSSSFINSDKLYFTNSDGTILYLNITPTPHTSTSHSTDNIPYEIILSKDDEDKLALTMPENKQYQYLRFGIEVVDINSITTTKSIDFVDATVYGYRAFAAPDVTTIALALFVPSTSGGTSGTVTIELKPAFYRSAHSGLNDNYSSASSLKLYGKENAQSSATLLLTVSNPFILTNNSKIITLSNFDFGTNSTYIFYLVYTVYSLSGSLSKTATTINIVIENNVPTVSYRKNRIGINYSNFTSTSASGYENAVAVINDVNNNYKIYLLGNNDHLMTIDMRTGDITGLNGLNTIDCGDWTRWQPGDVVIDGGEWS